jgi:ketopantoate hydroxymethyltransferase
MAEESVKAMKDYVKEVKEVKELIFPEPVHCYEMIEGEAEKLMAILNQR